LHLLQAALVHINTLLIQRILAEPAWAQRLGDADRISVPLIAQLRDPEPAQPRPYRGINEPPGPEDSAHCSSRRIIGKLSSARPCRDVMVMPERARAQRNPSLNEYEHWRRTREGVNGTRPYVDGAPTHPEHRV